MDRREPAAQVTRAKLAWSWVYVGLAVLLLCRLLLPASVFPSNLVSSAMSAERQAPEVERRVGDIPDSARDFEALQGETPDEDETSDVRVVVSRHAFDQASCRRVAASKHVVAARVGHLLVSTGLGRGPPIG
jgi:hypothetical protein